jgi:hypothetical protein
MRGSNEKKLDYEGFFAPSVLACYARYMHAHRKQMDGSLRASDNWQKGMPQEEYVKSLLRHTMDVWMIHRGETVFDPETGNRVTIFEALCGVMFNSMGLLFELLKGRKL